MDIGLHEQKKALRARIRQLKQEHSAEQLAEMSHELCQKLESLPEWQQAKCILLYFALPDEVQTQELLERWYGKKLLLLPVVQGDHLILRTYRPDGSMLANQWQIMEPVLGPEGTIEDFTDYRRIDLAVIPGMAFDREGYRLGRGKGFYDRFMPHLFCPTVGLCFPFQLVEHIPSESWDCHVDKVL